MHEAQYRNGKKNRFGIIKYNNGDIFEGKFKNDKKNGQGIYKWKMIYI